MWFTQILCAAIWWLQTLMARARRIRRHHTSGRGVGGVVVGGGGIGGVEGMITSAVWQRQAALVSDICIYICCKWVCVWKVRITAAAAGEFEETNDYAAHKFALYCSYFVRFAHSALCANPLIGTNAHTRPDAWVVDFVLKLSALLVTVQIQWDPGAEIAILQSAAGMPWIMYTQLESDVCARASADLRSATDKYYVILWHIGFRARIQCVMLGPNNTMTKRILVSVCVRELIVCNAV